MGQSFLEFAKTGLHKAMQNGADHAELFVVKGRSFEVELKLPFCCSWLPVVYPASTPFPSTASITPFT